MNTLLNNLAILNSLTGRNIRLYFKDKMMFLTSLISPLILLVLFSTFLKSVYTGTFTQIIPESILPSPDIPGAFTAGWMMSSILTVSCVTIAFSSNLVSAMDKINGAIFDILSAPVRKDILAVSYYLANFITTLAVCITAMAAGFVYIAFQGWYFDVRDVLLITSDVFIMVLYGTALAAICEYFIKSNGGVSAVTALISSMYGFLCGAYMPISQFSAGIRNVISFIPGSYGTVLLKKHYLMPVTEQLKDKAPAELVDALHDATDVNFYFFDNPVKVWQLYTILACSIVVLIAIYIAMSYFGSIRSKIHNKHARNPRPRKNSPIQGN